MDNVVRLPGVPDLAVATATDYSGYLRGLADLIDNGTLTLEGLALVLMLPGSKITAARVGINALEMAGALAIAGRMV